MKTILILLIAMITNGNFNKEIAWSDNIKNPDNSEFVVEVAFNLDISIKDVTQEQFNARYLPIQE